MITAADLGATTGTIDERERRVAEILSRLPAGTVQAGVMSLRHGLSVAEPAGAGTPAAVDPSVATVVNHLVAPIRLAGDWPDPTDPLPAAGGGAVHADLIDDDRDTLARLRAANPTLDAEALATEAQQWRLPVTPYRPLPPAPPPPAASPTGTGSGPGSSGTTGAERRPIEGRVVVDLSALWAGPLATSLLTAVGAVVVKIDPSCRPDAFGEHPDLYTRLNGDKEIVDLDLGTGIDRRRFERLLGKADLVVDSFSRRVMPNLGYGPDQLRSLDPAVATLSIVAFGDSSPERDWVAYGPGVHATSGLAATAPSGRFRPAPIAYPDVLAGFAAFAAAAELLTTPGPTAHREISLAGAIEPLVERAAAEREQWR